MANGKLLKPREVPPVPGAEDWREMYPSFITFDDGSSKEVAEFEDQQFWFRNHLHWPIAIRPLDEFFVGCDMNYISQFTSRVYVVPSAMGTPYRVLNGYVYNTSVEINDPKVIEERAKLNSQIMEYCLGNWDELFERWVKKTKETINEIEKIHFPSLPDQDNAVEIFKGPGTTLGHKICGENRKFWTLAEKTWCHHFELLMATYAKYLELMTFCNKHGFADALESLVKGMRPLVLEPEEKLKELSRLAVDLELQEIFKNYKGEEVFKELNKTENGKKWIEKFEEVKYPYFLASEAQGLYFDELSWLDDLTTLFNNLTEYIKKIDSGENIERDVEGLIKERDRVTKNAMRCLTSDKDRKEFDRILKQARLLYPFAEDHIFYIEYWSWGLLRQKIHELGKWLVDHGVLDSYMDIMYFKRYEIDEVLFDVCQAWGSGIPKKSPTIWKQRIEKRKKMHNALMNWTPPDILGKFPEKVTEPFTVMLWGISEDQLNKWREAFETGETVEEGDVNVIEGIAASPGVVEGTAKVITRLRESNIVQKGDILVTLSTSPGWAPVLSRVKGVVLDSGGRMCHGAIVAREEGVPAVVGTRTATSVIKTGDLIRVDGNKGTVEILKKASS